MEDLQPGRELDAEDRDLLHRMREIPWWGPDVAVASKIMDRLLYRYKVCKRLIIEDDESGKSIVKMQMISGEWVEERSFNRGNAMRLAVDLAVKNAQLT